MSDLRFKPQAIMKMAIEAMRQSVDESRGDGKATPKVGAVLLKPGAAPHSTAYRGELRDGDHAEYTLLERKNRDQKLDGCVLFTTLEPCAPGARHYPKVSCAERIVFARIKEVWVGIEDPDPTVGGKGIKYLQGNGVTIHMFDREFQQEIREFNKVFLAQALDRAAEAEAEKPTTVTLSNFENASADAALGDLSGEAMKQYRTLAKITETVGSTAFNRRLTQQGLLKPEKERLIPTGFGLLLFGKEPRTTMPQAGVLGTIHYSDGKEEPKDFDGPQVLAPEQALEWLRDKLPNPISRSGARRRETNEALFELTREGIVNAIVHRDYSIEGAKCQLLVTPDTIVVKSPGRPIKPITLEQLQSFNAPMLSRNPVLHYVFAKMDLAEERGLGLKSMMNRAAEANLPLPKYSWEDPYLVLTLYRTAESATRTLQQSVICKLTAEELKGWTFLRGRTSTTQSEYARHLGVVPRTAQRHLTHFVELGLLRRIGRGPATEYRIVGH